LVDEQPSRCCGHDGESDRPSESRGTSAITIEDVSARVAEGKQSIKGPGGAPGPEGTPAAGDAVDVAGRHAATSDGSADGQRAVARMAAHTILLVVGELRLMVLRWTMFGLS
jgi:hypothetical protein